jgi:hypothetical protein
MDVLAEVLSLLRTKGRLYGRLEFTAPWGFAFPGDKGICLMVTRGACFLGVDERALVPLVGAISSSCRHRTATPYGVVLRSLSVPCLI